MEDFHERYIKPFRGCDWILDGRGFIVWRFGTGRNVELLHIKTFEKGKGYGKQLFYEMLGCLKYNPPYHSVFGFTRVSNQEAHAFYAKLGFQLQPVMGIYKDGQATLFWESYEKLLEKMNHASDT